jgi:hypothetical protein
MKSKKTYVIVLTLLVGLSARQSRGQEAPGILRLALGRLELHKVEAEPATYRGRAGMRITATGTDVGAVGGLAIVRGSSFQDGTIEVNLSGDTAPKAPFYMRGFVGIAFRASADGSHFECFYLRPKNGRSEYQVQRNHSVQYISIPGFGYQTLRSESPGDYESYADLVPGQWTHVKIWVEGPLARLYLNGAKQPVLVVNGLKQPITAGSVALWVGPGTVAYFSDLEVTRAKAAKPSDIDGTWLGALNVEKRKLRVVFHIFNTEDGLRATLDSPDQGMTGVLVAPVARNGSQIRVKMGSIDGNFEGTINSSRTTIQGTWIQVGASQPLPLMLNRTHSLQGS